MIEEQSTQARVDAFLEEVLPRLGEIEDEALSRVREEEGAAAERISRHEAAAKELAGVEDRLAELRREDEALPLLHSRAVLDQDVDAQLRHEGRAQDLKAEVEASEARRGELEKELAGLLPGQSPTREPHPLDARIRHTAAVAGVAFGERQALDGLRDRLRKAADAAADAAKKEHEKHHGQVSSWTNSIEWERAPARGYRPPGEGGAA